MGEPGQDGEPGGRLERAVEARVPLAAAEQAKELDDVAGRTASVSAKASMTGALIAATSLERS